MQFVKDLEIKCTVGNSHMAVLLWATGLSFYWPVQGQAAPTPHILAGCGKRLFGAPLDLSSSLVQCSWLQLESHSSSQSEQHLGLLSDTTDATPRAVGLHCVQLATNSSARYGLLVQCINSEATINVGEIFAHRYLPASQYYIHIFVGSDNIWFFQVSVHG
jgi:hypothetical protein